MADLSDCQPFAFRSPFVPEFFLKHGLECGQAGFSPRPLGFPLDPLLFDFLNLLIEAGEHSSDIVTFHPRGLGVLCQLLQRFPQVRKFHKNLGAFGVALFAVFLEILNLEAELVLPGF